MGANYPTAILDLLAAHAGDWTDDLLGRLDPDGTLAISIARHLTSYCDVDALRGKRLLDFGCGVGSSSLHLARLLPETEIVGVELNAEKVRLGNHLAAYHELTNLRFLASPRGDQLPPEIDSFDVVTLCAVYEHLLPRERRTILPLLWRALKPGGTLLIGGTPYRWFPIEHHTTGLPLVNYLPAFLVLPLAQRFGKYRHKGDWSTYLRAGIRGGTEWSVLREIGDGTIAQPRDSDRAEYWLAGTSRRYRELKHALATLYRLTDRVLGTVPATHLEIAIHKH